MAQSAGPASRDRLVAEHIVSLLSAGSLAPDFTAAASDGQTYRLRDLLQGSRVLLVFYPGNNTPG